MASLFKWLFGLVVLIVVLVVAAVVILPMVIDPNDYKAQIVQTAEQKLGRDLAIEQDLGLSVFPWLGIETGGVRVGNAPGFSDQPFAEIEQLGLKVKLVPLLSSRVEVDTLVLEGLKLNLEKNAEGKTNWQDLAAPEDDAPSADPAPATGGDAGGGLALSVQGIQIEDARLSWDDRQSGQKMVLDGVRLVTGSLVPGATVPVEAGVTFTSNKPAMELVTVLRAQVATDAALAVYRISGLVLDLSASGEGLPAGGADLSLKADLVVDTKADKLRIDTLAFTGPALSATGELSVTALQTKPAVKGRLNVAETNLKTLASMFARPIETSDPDALTKAKGDLVFAYADGALKLDPLSFGLDDSNIEGYLHVLDTSAPVVRAELELDRIDLDRYMPPPTPETVTPAPAAQPAEGGQAAGPAAQANDPFAALRTLDLVAEFKIGSLKINNAKMSNFSTRLVSKKGVLKIDPVAADVYEGKFKGSVVLDAKGKKPKVSAKKHLTGIQVGPLLADVVGEDRLIGKGEWHADVSMVGLTEPEIRRSLNGTSRFAFRDGAVKGVNIAQIIRQGSQTLGLSGGDESTGTAGQTDFSELSGSLTMANGVIKNRDLQAKSPLLRIEGNGEVDLPRDAIDYLVITELVGSLEGQGGRGRDELAGLPIPVRIKGPLAKPSYKPDLEAALSAKAKAQLEEKKQELQQKVEDKVKEKLDDKLRELFR